MLISNKAIDNRTTVAVLMLIIVLGGGYCYRVLPREAAPDVPIPIVMVTTTYEGVSPEDIESSVTIKIEKEMSGLKGLKEMRSSSAEGVSTISLEFMPDVLMEDALQYVRDRVDAAKPELPDDAEEPFIKEINVAEEWPIMMISLSGTLSPVRMKAIADDLEDRIEQVPGVLGADVIGALEREIRLEIDPDRVASYDLTVPELLALIPAENVNISAGGLETPGTKFHVRVPGEFVDPGEVDHLLLTVREGKPIYLSDVATVRDTFKDRTSYARLNGENSITIRVRKRVGANVVAISDIIKEIVKRAQLEAPKGLRFDITYDVSKYIRMMVSDLENNILTGLVLVVGVLVLFLGLRTSLIVALAIPMSMLMSFTLISLLGYTLNMVVLFSLVLALGMLVDNAIVIVENIYRHRQLGYGKIEAAKVGTGEVAWPVIASTATTLAAFSPLIFWPGMMGDFMKYLPITVMITLGSSLFVAMVINPTVCSVFAGGRMREVKRDRRFVRGYRRMLRFIVEDGWKRFAALGMVFLLLAGMGLAYGLMGRGVEFFPDVDPDRAMVNIRCPQGTSVQETDRLARIAEGYVAAYAEELDHVIADVGGEGGMNPFGGGSAGPHVANLTLVFHDFEVRERPSAEVVAALRRDMSDFVGAEVKVEEEDEGPPAGAAVTVRIIGEDFKTLEVLSEKAKRTIASVPGLVNLRSDLEATRPELVFKVDRRRAMLSGLNTLVIGNYLKMAVFGREVGTYREFNDEYDITVRLPLSQRVDIDDLWRLRVPNASGEAVPLSSLGKFEYRGGFGTINRIDQKRVVTVTGDAEGRLGTAVLQDVMGRLEDFEMPGGYAIEYAGEQEEKEKAERFLTKAFIVAVLLIVMILVTQFNSVSVPFIIMTTVMLSLVGVLGGLLICDMPFGVIMTGIGVIGLAGVVVNNAIVLLAYTRQLQARGMGLIEGTVQAGATRLRPVLLTAVTTILGLIPMAIGVSYDFHIFEWATRSQSSEWWRSMAIAVIFGLAFATVLTLVVVPTLYVTLYRLATWMGFSGVKKEGAGEPA